MYIEYEGLMDVNAWIADSEGNHLPEHRRQPSKFEGDVDTFECVT
jgi:hypothetical protein